MTAAGFVWNLSALLLCLPLMVGACALFTNGLEWVGKKKAWSHGVVGSVLASLGTTLPETAIPLIAILVIGTHQAKDIGTGAILGAPFVLTTVAFAFSGAAAMFYSSARKSANHVLQSDILVKDLGWFVAAFSVALLCTRLRSAWLRLPVALALVLAYVLHVRGHFGELRQEEEDPSQLYFAPKHSNPHLATCAMQALLGLAIVLPIAYLFVTRIESLSSSIGVAPALLSLFVSPVASELPEIINSTIWMRQGRSTLALGNISGAIMFQGTILVALGMCLTPWLPERKVALSGAFSVAAALFAIFALRREKSPSLLLFCAGFYVAYLLLIMH